MTEPTAPTTPAPHRDDIDRLVSLARLGVLDTAREARFDDIVAAAQAACHVPIALVSLVADDRQVFKAALGVAVDETPIDTSVCALAIRQPGLFEIADLSADPRTSNFSLVTQEPHIRFYAGYPITLDNGVVLGTVCAIDFVPRPAGLTSAQALALEALARQAAVEIERGAHVPLPAMHAGENRIGVWDWDVVADRVTADAGFALLYGVDPSVAARGTSIADFFRGIHPDDLERVQAGIARAMAADVPFDEEYRLLRAGARPCWVSARGRAIRDADGTVVRFPGVSFDIDVRKRAELRLAALVSLSDRLREPGEPADLAFTAAEILGQTLEVSRVGYGTIDPVAETIAIERDWNAPGIKTIAGMLHFRDYGSYIENLKRGETVAVTDVFDDPRTQEDPAGLRAISAHSFINMPVTEQGGFVALLYLNHFEPREWPEEELSFVRDIAERTRDAVERRRAEHELADLTRSLEQQVAARTAELMQAEEQLRQAQKMEAVGQLTGGLAHDFNNMLTGITGALEMMQVRIAQGRINELDRYASAAQGAAKRAAALTHRLLAFSRRQTLDPKPTDVNRLVAGLEELIRRTVGPEITVEVVHAAGLWTAMVDPNQLENALLNLCINARDAMPDGGRLTIETANKWLDGRTARERDLPPGQYLSLCVSDTGTGMTPEVQARAFDPFYTTKPIGEGTGLGLSMIYGFARQSGGQVRIYSELGDGTTMCIYLPRHVGDDEDENEPDENVAASRSPLAGADTRTVLVVDDEPTIRMLVVEVLEEMGLAALEASDGPAAMRLLQSGVGVDLLITDVGLPGTMNGRQVADGALALLPRLKVLFITGYAENAVIGNGQLAPGTALLTKPFALDLLIARVREMLA